MAVLSLAVGIGANATVFGLLEALVHRTPAGVSAPQELVAIHSTTPSGQVARESYEVLRDSARTLSRLAARSPVWIWMTNGQDAAELSGAAVSGNYFSALGVKPELGRLLGEDDLRAGAERVALISYELWKARFHLDPDVLGRSIVLNRERHRIIGVASREFQGIYGNDRPGVWLPLTDDSASLDLVGRLSPGLSPTEAQAELSTLLASREATRQAPALQVSVLRGVHPALRNAVVRFPLLLLSLLALMLLITCANLASLLLGRAAHRQHEIALRVALGAGRTRVIRDALLESTLLSAGGGAASLLTAVWLATFAEKYLRYQLGGLQLEISGATITVALALAATCAVLSGTIPALQAASLEPFPALKQSPFQPSRTAATRGVLVAAQVAASVALLIGAALLLQSVRAVVTNPGFETRHIAQFRLRPSRNEYARPAAVRYYRELLARLSSVPGVEEAVIATVPPMRSWGSPVRVATARRVLETLSDHTTVSPGFLRALSIPLVRGREFTEDDRSGSPAVVVVSRALATTLWGSEDVVGRTLLLEGRPYQVIGIAADIHAPRPEESAPPYLYLAYWQSEEIDARLFVRTSGPAGSRIGEIRQVVIGADPDVHVGQDMTLADRAALSYESERLLGDLMMGAAAMALFLSTIGIYGVLSHSVSRRTREMGIRIALGAAPRLVIVSIVRQGMWPVLIGGASGLIGAWAGTRALASYLYGVTPRDPATFAASFLVVLLAGATACYIPARRAARVDPLVALRAE